MPSKAASREKPGVVDVNPAPSNLTPSSTTAPYCIIRDLDRRLQFVYNAVQLPQYVHVRPGTTLSHFLYQSGYTERAALEMLKVFTESTSREEFAEAMGTRGECFCYSEMLFVYALMKTSSY